MTALKLGTLAIVAVLVTIPAGCTVGDRTSPSANGGPAAAPTADTELTHMARRRLVRGLNDFTVTFQEQVQNTARDAQATLGEGEASDAVSHWRTFMLREADEVTHVEDDAVQTLADLWSLCVRVERSMRSGDTNGGRFGAAQEQIHATMTDLVGRVDVVARDILTRESYERLAEQITAHAEANPLPTIQAEADAQPFHAAEGVNNVLNAVAAPFRMVGRAVGGGREGFVEATNPTYRLSQSIDRAPQNIREQAEELVDELLADPRVQNIIDALTRFSTSAETLSQAAARLPDDLIRVLEETEARQPELRQTLTELRETLTAGHEMIAEAGSITADVKATVTAGEATATAFRELVESSRALVAEVREMQAEQAARATSQPAEPGKPFDITDYRATAEALTQTTTELRGLVSDVRGFLAAQDPNGPGGVRSDARHVVTATTSAAHTLIHEVWWRVGALVALIFVLAIVYRFVSWGLGRGRAAPRGSTKE